MNLNNFDPNMTGHSDSGLFGIPTTLENSSLALIPVPWEVTTSYGSGASEGPEAILQASPQLDLFDLRFGEAWRKGFHWMECLQRVVFLEFPTETHGPGSDPAARGKRSAQ